MSQQSQNYTIESVNDKSLMDPDNCRYDSNPVSGPSPFLYADVVAVDSENSEDEAEDAMRTCE